MKGAAYGWPPSRVVVGGTGRSGTGFLAGVLSANGIPTGHERVITPAVACGFAQPVWDVRVDVSWMAVYRHRPRALILRDPWEVAASFVGIGFFDWSRIDQGKHRAVVAMHTPEVLDGKTPAERAVLHVVASTRRGLDSAERVIRVERLSVDDVRIIGEWAGVPVSAPHLRGGDRNRRGSKPSAEVVRSAVSDRLVAMVDALYPTT